jgi:hypothetical protein
MGTNLQLTGTVQSGGTDKTLPLTGVSVTLYEATTDAPVTVGTATTDDDGKFSLDTSGAASDTIFFATASLGGGVQLVTIIGPNIPASITINELTTVAAAFSMAQFTQNGVIAGNAFGLRIASGMNDNLVSPLTGASSDVLVNSPNGVRQTRCAPRAPSPICSRPASKIRTALSRRCSSPRRLVEPRRTIRSKLWSISASIPRITYRTYTRRPKPRTCTRRRSNK